MGLFDLNQEIEKNYYRRFHNMTTEILVDKDNNSGSNSSSSGNSTDSNGDISFSVYNTYKTPPLLVIYYMYIQI